jgi:hypothetical protein
MKLLYLFKEKPTRPYVDVDNELKKFALKTHNDVI